MSSRFNLKSELKILAFGLLGSFIMAVNIKSFVHTGGLYPGGFNGVTLLIQTIFDRFFGIALPFSPISLALNAVPAIISFKVIGKRFTLNTALIIVVTSLFTDIVPAIPITQDILLISVFGGLVNGVAISICLIGGTSTGGTGFYRGVFSRKEKQGCLELYSDRKRYGACHSGHTVWLGQGALFNHIPVHLDRDDKASLSGSQQGYAVYRYGLSK